MTGRINMETIWGINNIIEKCCEVTLSYIMDVLINKICYGVV